MSSIKLLIIEDDPIWALKLRMMAEQLGCTLLKICNQIDSVALDIAQYQPDVIISDVQIDAQRTIFDMQDVFGNIPTIFVTAHAAIGYQELAVQIPNAYFLIKPFHFLSLKAIFDKIELFILKKAQKELIKKIEHSLEVTNKYRHKKYIPLEKILYLEAEGNYTLIHMENKKISIKRSLSKVGRDLCQRFVQIQRGYIVNSKYITRVDYSRQLVYINGNPLPLGRTYRKPIMDILES